MPYEVMFVFIVDFEQVFYLKHVSISGKDLPVALYIRHTRYTFPNHTKYYQCIFRRKISIVIYIFAKSFEMMTTKKSTLIFKALSYGNNISSISSLSILLLTNTFPYSGHREPFANISRQFLAGNCFSTNVPLQMLDTVLNTLLVFSKTALSRSSRSQMFLECSKNFATLTRKHLCCSLFLIKLQASRHVTLLKRDSNAGVFL